MYTLLLQVCSNGSTSCGLSGQHIENITTVSAYTVYFIFTSLCSST